MAQAPDHSLARPTDAPPLAHDVTSEAVASEVDAPTAEAPLLATEDLPGHVAIIMDGNRRWARAKGITDFEGHAAGVEAVRSLLQHAVRRGVPMLTLYAFSRENWARSDDEVAGLFDLLARAIASETDELAAQGVRVRLIGRLEELPDETRSAIEGALERTAEGTRLQLNVAWNYAGRTELVDAVRRIVADGVPMEQIDERTVCEALYTAGMPDPDLVIRTGGEQRISNFLIWQSAYAELWFTDCLWPDFGHSTFDEALIEFARRTRRFGR
ncbi:MAG TPA: polyprenyl diphosphate synthase [Myxococcaceae bacterium]|nr:polyprenyl diphosphate synthase [Myxococcaceae bacterium]